MTGPHEIALGIATVLGQPGLPNPMIISFRGQSLESAAEVVMAIISECEDAGIGIAKIELDPELHNNLAEGDYSIAVTLRACDDLFGEIKVFAK